MVRRLLTFLSAVSIALTALVFTPPVYADGENNIGFTPAEEKYISEHKVLRIGYVQDRIPVSFSDENGELAGISRYIFDHVSELCGLKFEYVPLPAGDVKAGPCFKRRVQQGKPNGARNTYKQPLPVEP